ncbi:hypothetical protein C8Q79DRAFT_963312 [Trametes meyenii]|nr:hypothetical protein C8Q79DRAFT_963312 [Trametes meyenii]
MSGRCTRPGPAFNEAFAMPCHARFVPAFLLGAVPRRGPRSPVNVRRGYLDWY